MTGASGGGDIAGRTWDAVVIGAGPAGAVASRELARRGRQVLLVERSRMPRYKVCGGCLNARALNALAAAGLRDRVKSAGARPVSAFRVALNRIHAELALPQGVAISRTALDAELVDAAREAGVTVVEGAAAVPEKLQDGTWFVWLREGERAFQVETRSCVVASGLNAETVRALPDVRIRVDVGSRIGAGALLDADDTDYTPGAIFMAVHRAGYVGLVRVEENRLNVAAAFDAVFVRGRGGPGEAAAHVLEASGYPVPAGLRDAVWRGTPPLTRRVVPVAGERFIVLGDAAGYAEPFTGEGMAWALEGALLASRLVGEHIETWDEATTRQWIEMHKKCVTRGQRRCRLVAAGLRHPGLAASVARLLRAAPGLAGPVVRALNESEFTEESAV